LHSKGASRQNYVGPRRELTSKAEIYQAQGNLREAARLLSEINLETASDAFVTKVDQLRLERNYGQAIRLLEARLAQFDYIDQDKKHRDRIRLALIQRLAGDTAGAKAKAEQLRNALEQPYRDQSANAQPTLAYPAGRIARIYALLGEKDLAIKTAERAVMLMPRAMDPIYGPRHEENLALILTMFGENSRAISAFAQLLQTHYDSSWYGGPGITPAVLRLDPLWDPLRGDPAFQKLCEEKQK